ncbi:MAG: hypothetical protein JWN46_2383 [Acidimicrobiales bacterium]|nr:hypothetical protein [Acidimicrobiales bacterium]
MAWWSGPGSAVGSLARADLRRRGRAVMAGGALIGLAAGIGMACIAGARRTDSLFPRHLAATRASDVEIDPGNLDPAADRAIRTLPNVVAASEWVVVEALPMQGGRPVDTLRTALPFTTDGRFLGPDLVSLAGGRRLDPTRPGEVMVNALYARIAHLHLGSRQQVGVFAATDNGAPLGKATRVETVTVVGIMALNDDVISEQLDRVPRIFVSPALMKGAPKSAFGFSWYGLRLAHGDADVDQVVTRWKQLAADHNRTLPKDQGGWLTFVHRTADQERTVSRAIRPLVTSLGAFGVLALVAAVVLAAQGMGRAVRQGADDTSIAQVLGLTSGEATLVGLAVPVATVVTAGLVAVGVAVGLSSRFPAGPYRILEPAPGVQVDALVLAAGLAALILLPVAVAAVVALRLARAGTAGQRDGARRPSRLVAWVARSGARPPLVASLRLTVEPGRGRAYVPTRSVLISSIVTVTFLITTIVFGSNLRALANEPARFGWTADGALLSDGGYGQFDPKVTTPWLNARTDIDGWLLVGADRTSLDGRQTAGVVYGPSRGRGAGMLPVIISGRAPRATGEIVAGAATLKSLHAHVGDAVTLGSGAGARRVRVTGTAVLPALGPVFAVRTRPDDGVWVMPGDRAAFDTLGSYGPPWNVVLLGFTPTSDLAVLNRDADKGPFLAPGTDADVYGVIRPSEVSTAASAGRGQNALIATLLGVAVLGLMLTLVAVVRRRRHDFAIYRTLGFTPGQLRLTVVGQGLLFAVAASVLGLPLGMVLGRQLWRLFAQRLGVVPAPTVAWPPLGLALVGVVLAGLLGALLPSLLAGRSAFAEAQRARGDVRS